MALAVAWAARITTISLSMVVPGLIGYGIDAYFNTIPIFAGIGFALGMGLGFWQLIRIAAISNRESKPPHGEDSEDRKRD